MAFGKNRTKCFACGRVFKIKDPKKNLYCERCRTTELYKDRKMMEETLENDDTVFYNLVYAIVDDACRDYINCVKNWHKEYDGKKKQEYFYRIKTLSYWFTSRDFEIFNTEIDGRTLQLKLNKEAKKKFMKKITNMEQF